MTLPPRSIKRQDHFFLREYKSSQRAHFEESKSVMKRFAMSFLWKLYGVGVLFGTIY